MKWTHTSTGGLVPKYPPAVAMGRKGGSVKSARKTAAVRENARKSWSPSARAKRLANIIAREKAAAAIAAAGPIVAILIALL